MRLRVLSVVAAALVAAPATYAQRATARLEGTVTDSLHGRPLVGATVLLTRNAPEPAAWYNATTDDRGRFRFDTLLAGRYSLAMWHPMLDSIELALPPQAVEIREGQRLSLDLATPSGATLRATACPGVTLPPGTGVLQGQVLDADADGPLAGAIVAVRWSDLVVDRATLQVVGAEHAVGARTNAQGAYRLCGLPTDSWLVVQIQHTGRGGTVVRTSIADSVGLVVLNLSLSKESARVLAANDSTADSTAQADMTPPPLLSGSASVSGTVLGETGQPLAGVQLRVLETAATARTDSTGHYALSALPAGTQLLEAKRIGYRIVQQPVQLLRGRGIEVGVRLQRVVSLDSIRVVAQRSRYREFERQRKGGFGRFFTEDDIEKRHAIEVTDLLRMTPGFRIVGSGFDARVVSSRGSISFSKRACDANVVIDGMQHQEINWLQPSDIGAMEVYSGPAGAPLQYDSACGVIVIWTKR